MATTFNLKLQDSVRARFKNITHERGISMQTALAAFVEAYISDPNKFKIKIEINSQEA